jgi:Tol biopolymer transport system component
MSHRHRVYLGYRVCLAAVLAAAVGGLPLAAEQTLDRVELVTRVPFAEGDAHFGVHLVHPRRAMSADGRFVAWNSTASALVAGVEDLNGTGDIFLTDIVTGETRLISHRPGDPSRTAHGQILGAPLLSTDGRYLAFASLPVDASGHATAAVQVYLYDRIADTLQLVTDALASGAPSNFQNELLAMTPDGRYLAIGSDATDLMPGITDFGPSRDLFLWDRQTDTFHLVTHRHNSATTTAPTGGNGFVGTRLSADGRYVVFSSSSREMVAGVDIPAGAVRIFLHDRQSGVNSLVSGMPPPLAPTSVDRVVDLTPDGRFALFATMEMASLMVPGATDPFGTYDLFLFDRTSAAVELITRVPGAGLAAGNDDVGHGWLSDDGQTVYFASDATNLVAGIADDADSSDLFLRDRVAGTTSLLSRSAAAPTVAAHVDILAGLVSSDGASFSFSSDSPALIAGLAGNGRQAFRYDRGTGQFSLLNPDPGSPTVGQPTEVRAMTADGEHYLWTLPDAATSTGTPDPQVDGGDLIAYDRLAESSKLLNPAAFGGIEAGYGENRSARLSQGGWTVAFLTRSRLCAPEQALPNALRACLLDRRSGELSLLSHAWDDPDQATSATDSELLEFSSDGRKLLLQGLEATMAPDDDNFACDLFLYDLPSRTFELISQVSGQPGTTANGDSCQVFANAIASPDSPVPRPLLSDDATKVVFASSSRNLLPGPPEGNSVSDVFLRNRTAGTTLRLSNAAGSSGPANGESQGPEISGNGLYATFYSAATDLLTGFVDANAGGQELFLADLNAGTRTLVSRSASSPLQSGNGVLHDRSSLSADGRFVAFTSLATDHVAGATDGNNAFDVFLFDRATGTNTLVSHALGQPATAASRASYLQDLSRDGRYVLFLSTSTDLVAGVSGLQVFRWDGVDGSVRLVSHQDGRPDLETRALWGRLLGSGGKAIFASGSNSVLDLTEDANNVADLFLWDPATPKIELLSRRLADPFRTGNGSSPSLEIPQVDRGGSSVLFASAASNLVEHDGNGDGEDYFLAVLGLFADGFETGDTSGWTSAQP